MEEEDVIIILVIFKFEDGRLYNFDVDRTTTFYEVKKILSNAAHIPKNSFTLYHEGQEYSNEYDEQTLQKIFPTYKKIEFYLKLKKILEEQDENEHEHISVKYNIKEPCKEHIGKFLVLYCISCKKSICNECFSISHNNHEVEEKADYLMPAKILMERIFANSFMFKSDPKLSNYMQCVSFRSIIKTEVFDRMRQLINELENKTINCLEFFSFNEDSTEKNNDLNLELLKKYCTSSFIKLKNNIDTKEILINDEVFLSLYNKLKAIKDYEIALFTENANKYKTLNQFFLPFTQEIKNMSIDLNNILTRYINKDIYAKFKEDISKNIVDVVQKEDVIRFMFENVNVPKSTLIRPEENYNKNSHTPNINQRLLPSILLFNEAKNNNNNNITSTINKQQSNMTTSNINNNISMNTISNSNTGISPINPLTNAINNSIKYQQVQQNFTISSPNPILFSQTNSNNTNNNTTTNINTSNINTSNINTSNISTSNLNTSNLNTSNLNTSNLNTGNNNIGSSMKMNLNLPNMPNISKNTNSNNMSILSNINNNKNIILPNLQNNTNQNISKLNNNMTNMTMTTMTMTSMKTINNMNNMNSLNSMNNMNNNVNNVNNVNNMNIMNNMNTINANNLSKENNNMNNITSMSSMNNINNINNINTMSNINKNMSNFLYVKNVSECTHENLATKEEKEKSKCDKIEKMEVEESGETPPTQNSPNQKGSDITYSQTKIEEIKSNLTSDKNSYASPIMKKALISVHLSPNKKDENIDTKSDTFATNTYIQQKGLFFQNDSKDKNNLEMATIKSKFESSQVGTFKNSINNVSIFNGKLIDVLNKEKNNIPSGEIIIEKKEEKSLSQESPIFSKKLISNENNNNTNITSNITSTTTIHNVNNVNEKYFSQKIEKTQINYNINSPQKNISVAFMYPVFKTNIIKVALDKNTVQELKIKFTQFATEDPIITEFPNGGAYCNYENNFYFSGGQEYIKEAGRLFLSLAKNVNVENAVKLPLMKYSHWNHSMIAENEKVYVIGGFNSNKCEVYDIAKKTWNELPDLLAKERQRSMLFIENNFLYCFMGLTQNGIIDSVERLNLDNLEAGWENVNIINSGEINLKFYGAGIIRMNKSNKIFFIGGKKENKKKEIVFKRSIYEFSFDDSKMGVSDFKIENDLLFVENKLFLLDSNDCGNFINVGNGYLISMPNLVK